MRLYQIPKGSKLKLPVKVGDADEAVEIVTYHHIDGMYSYCTIDRLPEGQNVVNLVAFMRVVKFGDHYIPLGDDTKDEDDLLTQEEKLRID